MNPKKAQKAIQSAAKFFQQGNFSEAESLLSGLRKHNIQHELVWFISGVILFRQQQYSRAAECLSRAIKINPANAETHNNLGMCREQLGDTSSAIACYEAALKIKPDYINALLNLGNIYQNKENYDRARACFESILKLQPQDVRAINNLSLVHLQMGDYTGCQQLVDRGLQISPSDLSLHMTHGVLMQYQRRYGDALRHFQALDAAVPGNVDILNNIGLNFRNLDNWEQARNIFQQILHIDPHFRAAHHNIAQMALAESDFAIGWNEYRFRISQAEPDAIPVFPDSLADCRILVKKDQGLGDEIFFLRFLPELKARGAHITYLTDPRLMPLLRTQPAIDELISQMPTNTSFDYTVMVADLPWALQAHTIPAAIKLQSDTTISRNIASRLASLPAGRNIGLTWRAGVSGHNKLDKQIALEDLARLLQKQQGNLIVLQRNPEAEELARLQSLTGRPVYDFSGTNNTLEQILALLDSIDEHICVSNTNVHLRESLGKVSTVLVTYPADWRWMRLGTQSPWLPLCRIIRQAADGNWPTGL